MPEEPEKQYHVMWDYQVGLVRITPFFKALKYSKVCFDLLDRATSADHC